MMVVRLLYTFTCCGWPYICYFLLHAAVRSQSLCSAQLYFVPGILYNSILPQLYFVPGGDYAALPRILACSHPFFCLKGTW